MSKLACDFAEFFDSKITKIYEDICSSATPDSQIHMTDEEPTAHKLSVFHPVTAEDVHKIIKRSPIKACALDPIPAKLFTNILPTLIPVITDIINLSITNSTVPHYLKEAMITPILKKPQLDVQVLNNYRPVSNLPFISKVIERVIASQLNAHIQEHSLGEPLQSAYRQSHSTETALIYVVNDLLLCLDRKQSVLLVLLDLSAAFDTVDHAALLDRLTTRIGLEGTAREWVESYLSGRSQCVSIAGVKSPPQLLARGVPQGSVLGPIFFTIYTLPLGDIIRKYGMKFHLYADDTQLYMTFDSNILGDKESSITTMESCISEIKSWMVKNKLKLNDGKTELLLLNAHKDRTRDAGTTIKIGDDTIGTTSAAKNLGVLIDSDLTLSPYITSICKAANFHLFRLSRIRKYLTPQALKMAVHSLVSSKMDYCNSLLIGLPKSHIGKLQHVMNCAARLVSGVGKFEHITPVLKDLHWLPVEQRLEFKVLCLTYKALNGLAPQYLRDTLTPYKPARSLRSADQELLCIPKMRLKTIAARAFSSVAPTLYNAIPIEIHQAPSFECFKANLKTHLFRKAYS